MVSWMFNQNQSKEKIVMTFTTCADAENEQEKTENTFQMMFN